MSGEASAARSLPFKGGRVAWNTALNIYRRWLGMTDIAFAAHVAITRGCNWITRSAETTGTPIFFMLAELDDWTPPGPCVEQAERLRSAGNRKIEVKVFKGAHDAWESLGAARHFDPLAGNYSRCRVWIEDNGAMVSAPSGEPIRRRNWHAWAKSNCMTLGAHCCGGTRELKRQATRDLIGFLKRHGF